MPTTTTTSTRSTTKRRSPTKLFHPDIFSLLHFFQFYSVHEHKDDMVPYLALSSVTYFSLSLSLSLSVSPLFSINGFFCTLYFSGVIGGSLILFLAFPFVAPLLYSLLLTFVFFVHFVFFFSSSRIYSNMHHLPLVMCSCFRMTPHIDEPQRTVRIHTKKITVHKRARACVCVCVCMCVHMLAAPFIPPSSTMFSPHVSSFAFYGSAAFTMAAVCFPFFPMNSNACSLVTVPPLFVLSSFFLILFLLKTCFEHLAASRTTSHRTFLASPPVLRSRSNGCRRGKDGADDARLEGASFDKDSVASLHDMHLSLSLCTSISQLHSPSPSRVRTSHAHAHTRTVSLASQLFCRRHVSPYPSAAGCGNIRVPHLWIHTPHAGSRRLTSTAAATGEHVRNSVFFFFPPTSITLFLLVEVKLRRTAGWTGVCTFVFLGTAPSLHLLLFTCPRLHPQQCAHVILLFFFSSSFLSPVWNGYVDLSALKQVSRSLFLSSTFIHPVFLLPFFSFLWFTTTVIGCLLFVSVSSSFFFFCSLSPTLFFKENYTLKSAFSLSYNKNLPCKYILNHFFFSFPIFLCALNHPSRASLLFGLSFSSFNVTFSDFQPPLPPPLVDATR